MPYDAYAGITTMRTSPRFTPISPKAWPRSTMRPDSGPTSPSLQPAFRDDRLEPALCRGEPFTPNPALTEAGNRGRYIWLTRRPIAAVATARAGC